MKMLNTKQNYQEERYEKLHSNAYFYCDVNIL